jgi:hypothetical protein
MFQTGTQITTTSSPAMMASPMVATCSARKYVHTALSEFSSAVVTRALVIETPPAA